MHPYPFILLLITLLGSGYDTALHLKLTRAEPAKDAVLDTPPAEIRLWFNQKVKTPVSGISLARGETAVETGAITTSDDPMSFVLPLEPLPAGAYTVNWKTAGDDDHVIKGSYSFTIR